MQNLSLGDLGWTFGTLIIFVLVRVFWPRPWSDLLVLARALWYRYVGDWSVLMERVADVGVNDYQDDDTPEDRVMSRTQSAVPPAELVRPDLVLPDMYQVRGGSGVAFVNRPDLQRNIISRRMVRTDLVTLLAVQRNERGGYLWSKNQIAAFIGGTRADTLKLIGEARGDVEPQYRDLDGNSRPILR